MRSDTHQIVWVHVISHATDDVPTNARAPRVDTPLEKRMLQQSVHIFLFFGVAHYHKNNYC